MATRAIKKINFGTIGTYTVVTGETVRGGMPVILHTADTTIDEAIATDDTAIGIALGFGTTYTAGQEVQVLHYGPIVPVLVGTGGATRGTKAVVAGAADGLTDAAAHNSDGTGNVNVLGVFMQTGSAADEVGMMMVLGNRGS